LAHLERSYLLTSDRRVLKWWQLRVFLVRLVVLAVVFIFISVARHNRRMFERWQVHNRMFVVKLVVLAVVLGVVFIFVSVTLHNGRVLKWW
jgi:hypothetical protein